MKIVIYSLLVAFLSQIYAYAQNDEVELEARVFETDPYRVTSQSLLESFGDEGSLGIAGENTTRALNFVGLAIIKHFEGLVITAYNDPAGYCTIGYGHLIKLGLCEMVLSSELKKITSDEFENGLTDSRASELLEQDTRDARKVVSRLVEVDLSEDQFSALASFVFNIGGTNFSNSTLLSLLNEGAYDAAAEEFPRWVKANGRLLPGLVARRACEQALFREDLYLDRELPFDRARCQSLGIATSTQSLIDIEIGE